MSQTKNRMRTALLCFIPNKLTIMEEVGESIAYKFKVF